MFGAIFNFFETLIYVVLFIVFIPNFFFTLPSDGEKMTVAAVHGILYSLAFMIIKIIFNSKRIALCAASGGTASV
jgi:hypothetical protein